MSDGKPLSLDGAPLRLQGPDQPQAASGQSAAPGASPATDMEAGTTASRPDAGAGHNAQGPLTLGAAVCGASGLNMNPWGVESAPSGGTRASGPAPSRAPEGGPPTSGGGSWTWSPAGMEPKHPWRKRHPILFWGGLLLLLALVFGVGRMSVQESALSGPQIAVIQLDGMILDAEAIVGFMDKVCKDPTFKGAILRINSPGGAVGPSQEIFAAAKRLAQAKPLVASMSSVAASGGYYAALGAKSIIAGPSSVTASIGVKMQVPNFEGLMRTIGVSETTLTTGGLKDAGSSWREMSLEERAYFQGLITDMYEEFVATVAKERRLPPEKVRAVADGRAMTGRQALEAGLVDELGDFYAAVSKVKELAGLPAGEEAALVKGPEKPSTFLSRMIGSAVNSALQQSAAAGQPVFIY